MNRKTGWILGGIVLIGWAATIVLAVHFHQQAQTYQRERDAAPPPARAEAPVARARPFPTFESPSDLPPREVPRRRAAPASEETLTAVAPETTATAAPQPRQRLTVNWQERMEAWRQENPERYAEMVRRRDEIRQQVSAAFAQKSEHLLNQAAADMSPAERSEYNKLVKLLDETSRLTEQLQSNLQMENRLEVARTLRDNLRAIEPLMVNERNRELYRLGRDLGYSDADAQLFVHQLNAIYETTSMRNLFPVGRAMGGAGEGRRERPARR